MRVKHELDVGVAVGDADARAGRERHGGDDKEHSTGHGGEVDIRGRRDFSRFDPSPGEAPLYLANLVRPWSEDLFVK